MATETQMTHVGNGTALALARDNEGSDLAAARNFLTDDKIALLKRTICEGATDDELELFVAQCRRTGLDPFVRQIHAVKRWNGEARREVMTIQVGIDGLRLIAERTGNYAPGQDTEYVYDKAGGLVKATAYIKKWVHGEWHTVPASALWAEYCQTKKDGSPMAMWGRLPHVMLEKCAEARALRRAFPQETSGLYIHEEMAQADSEATALTASPPHQQNGPSRPPSAPGRLPAPAQPRPVPQAQDDALVCASCHVPLTKGQKDLSVLKYSEPLCPSCQKVRGQGQPQPTPRRPAPPPIDQEAADEYESLVGGSDDDLDALLDVPPTAGPGHGD